MTNIAERMFVQDLIDKLKQLDPQHLTNVGEIRRVNEMSGTRVRLVSVQELESEAQNDNLRRRG